MDTQICEAWRRPVLRRVARWRRARAEAERVGGRAAGRDPGRPRALAPVGRAASQGLGAAAPRRGPRWRDRRRCAERDMGLRRRGDVAGNRTSPSHGGARGSPAPIATGRNREQTVAAMWRAACQNPETIRSTAATMSSRRASASPTTGPSSLRARATSWDIRITQAASPTARSRCSLGTSAPHSDRRTTGAHRT